ncbi:MAG: hypothetical protein U0835_26425 [Isosphaeraceae bacterium]
MATGNLRGRGRHPHADARPGWHWAIGLPLGYLLAFVLDRGVIGLWFGLSLGLAVAACLLLYAWTLRARDLTALRAARH